MWLWKRLVSMRARSPVWASETGLARTLAQIGELARRLEAGKFFQRFQYFLGGIRSLKF